MSKQFGESIIDKVLELRDEGFLQRTIAKQLGFEYKQIKKLIERYNRKAREGIRIPKANRGRPRKNPIKKELEYKKRIKQLEMEVDLYRSFLQAVGRM